MLTRRPFLRRPRSGQALVEFIFTFPILMMVLMAILDFGYLLFLENSMGHGVRAGLRLAETNRATREQIIAEVRGGVTGATLRPEQVKITTNPGDSTFGIPLPTVSVAVEYEHRYFAPWMWTAVPSRVRVEARGIVSTYPGRETISF